MHTQTHTPTRTRTYTYTRGPALFEYKGVERFLVALYYLGWIAVIYIDIKGPRGAIHPQKSGGLSFMYVFTLYVYIFTHAHLHISLSLSLSLWPVATRDSEGPYTRKNQVASHSYMYSQCIHIYSHTHTYIFLSLSISRYNRWHPGTQRSKTPAEIRRLVVHISMYIVHIHIHTRTHTYFSLSLSPCITSSIKGLRGAIHPQKSGGLGEGLRTKSLYLWEREVQREGERERRRKKMGGHIWVLHVTYDWGMSRMNEHTTSHMNKYECVVAHRREACHVRVRYVTFE